MIVSVWSAGTVHLSDPIHFGGLLIDVAIDPDILPAEKLRS